MTEEELKNATGQELIEQRNYCGTDNYYRDYLDNVNAEMLRRFNHIIELKKENEQLQQKWLDSEWEKQKLVSQIKKMRCCENCDGWDYIPNTGERNCIETCCSNRSNWRLRDRS